MYPNQLIDGKAIAEQINRATRRRVLALKRRGVVPRLEVILVGADPASLLYDRMKGAAAGRLGIEFALHQLPARLTPQALIKKIKNIQASSKLSGLIIQLPVPERLYIPEVFNAIHPEVDVDFLTNFNLGALVMNTNQLAPPTPGAVLTILQTLKTNLSGANVTIVGTGALVGRPLAIMLINAGASVTTVNSRTRRPAQKCLGADIIVTGVGKKHLLRGPMVKPGAIVIDTGVSFHHGRAYGDVHLPSVIKRARLVTPTPGGVGPITVALLMQNTVASAEQKYARKTS